MIYVETEKPNLWWQMPFCKTEIVCILDSMVKIAFDSSDREQNSLCDLEQYSDIKTHSNQNVTYETQYELELLLVCDAEMTQINHQQMDCLGPTNILSFPAQQFCNEALCSTQHCVKDSANTFPSTADSFFIGSLVLDVHQLCREALLYGQNLQEHCLRLLAHGLAHLAGYDHSAEMDELCTEMVQNVKKNFFQKSDIFSSENL